MRVLGEFESRSIPYNLAVVPSQLEDEDFGWLNSLDHASISMHGVTHAHVVNRGRVGNEFTGNSVSENVDLLKIGFEQFDGLGTRSFVPPHNIYESNLLEAAKQLGFEIFYAGYPMVWNRRSILPVLHSAPPFYGRSYEVMDSVFGRKARTTFRKRAQSIKYRLGMRVWNTFRQSTTSVPDLSGVQQIALHWTWENDVENSSKYQVSQLAEWLTTQHVLNEDDLLSEKRAK